MPGFDVNVFKSSNPNFDVNLFKPSKLKGFPFENHPINLQSIDVKEPYLIMLCAVASFKDENNKYLDKIFSTVEEVQSKDDYYEKISTINSEFVENFKETFVNDDIKYNLLLDMLMTANISYSSKNSETNEFINDIFDLLEINEDVKKSIILLSESIIKNDKEVYCNVINNLCKNIDYEKHFKCYSNAYNIQDVKIVEKDNSLVITSLKGCETVFDIKEYLFNSAENFEILNMSFNNCKLDISKCDFDFTKFSNLPIENLTFNNCEFYSSDICNGFNVRLNLSFNNCTFKNITLNQTDFIHNDGCSTKSATTIQNCYFDNIKGFEVFLFTLCPNADKNNNISRIANSKFYNLEGSMLFNKYRFSGNGNLIMKFCILDKCKFFIMCEGSHIDYDSCYMNYECVPLEYNPNQEPMIFTRN